MKKTLLLILALCGTMSVKAQESPWVSAEAATGTFYLYNVESGMWLQNNRRARDYWTTFVQVGPHGFDFNLTKMEDGRYQLDPRFGHNHSVNGGDNAYGYMDTGQDVTYWDFEKTNQGYVISANDKAHYLNVSQGFIENVVDDDWVIDDLALEDSHWLLVTKEDRLADLAKATKENGKDATWLIDDWDFANQNERWASWKNEVTGSGSGIVVRDGFNCIANRAFECWSGGHGEFYQVIEGVPNGTYGLTVQGFYRDGSTSGVLGKYEEGTEVTVTAIAADGYEFINWTEGNEVVSEDAEYTFAIAADRDLIANFEPEVGMYNITVAPCENGSITAPAAAEPNTTVTVQATAYPFYVLSDLYYYTTDPEETTAINLATLEFVMPEANVTIVGTFVPNENNYDVNDDGIINIVDVIAIINYIAGNEPTPFIVERAYVNEDDVIDIADAMALNAMILGLKGDCDDYTAQYDILNGKLYIESAVALAGYQFSLSAEPNVIDMPGFTTIGNWKDGEYVLCLFNLSNEKEAGMYAVLDLNGANVGDIVAATLQGCKVNMEKGTLSVNSFDETMYSVFPVPANTEITVEGPSIEFVEVYNAMGQMVKVVNDINAERAKINMSDLSAGSYLVRIHASNGIAVKNVIVVR